MNMSPALGVEILNRILKIIKDYCGMLTEEAVRKNFALIYELVGPLATKESLKAAGAITEKPREVLERRERKLAEAEPKELLERRKERANKK